MKKYEILKKIVMEALESQAIINLDVICFQQVSPTEGLTLAHEAVSQGILIEIKGRQGLWKVVSNLTEADLITALARLCWKNGFNTAGVKYAWEAFKLLKDDPTAINKAVALCDEIFEVSGRGVGGMSEADYSGAIEIAKKQGNIPTTIRFMIRVVIWDVARHSNENAIKYLPELKKLVAQVDDPDLISSVTVLESIILAIGGRLQAAVNHYESYLMPFDQIFTNSLFPRTCGFLIKAYIEVGQTNISSGMIQEIGILADRTHDHSLKVFSNFCCAYNELISGAEKEAKARFIKLIEESQATEESLFIGLAYMELAGMASEDEDWSACVDFFDKSISLTTEAGFETCFNTSAIFKAIVGVEISQTPFKEYWPSYEESINVFRRNDNPFMVGGALLAKAVQLRIQKGDLKKRNSLLTEAKSAYKESGSQMGLGKLELEFARLALEENRDAEVRKHVQNAAVNFRHMAPNLIHEELRHFMGETCYCPQGVSVFQKVVDLVTSMNRMELNPLLAKGLRTLCDLCHAPWAGIWLPTKNGKFELTAGCNLTKLSLDSPEFEPIIKLIYKAGNNHQSTQVTTSLASKVIVLHLNIRSRSIGVLCYGESLSPNDLDILSEELVKVFVSLFAVEIDHAQKYQEVENLTQKLKEENEYYREVEFSRENFGEIIGNSAKILHTLELVSQVAPTNSTVLLQGETGSGKELFAIAVHKASKVSDGPFIQLNCAAIPAELVESELFGHEKGAFTGAILRKPGRFELANQGTLLLDEIGELSLAAQAKLLRVLQNGEFTRVGGTKTLKSDFRLIAATHRNLRKMVENGSFRKDLYYRLTVFPINIPPLRERKEDIPLLALSFLESQMHNLNQEEIAIPKTEMQKLIDYNWPGNVRELIHVVERGAILSLGNPFRTPPLTSPTNYTINKESASQTLEEVEREHIQAVLAQVDGRISGSGGAAEILGINRNTLYGRMRKLNIR